MIHCGDYQSKRAALKIIHLKKLRFEYERSLRQFYEELSAVSKRIKRLELKLKHYKKILGYQRSVPVSYLLLLYLFNLI